MHTDLLQIRGLEPTDSCKNAGEPLAPQAMSDPIRPRHYACAFRFDEEDVLGGDAVRRDRPPAGDQPIACSNGRPFFVPYCVWIVPRTHHPPSIASKHRHSFHSGKGIAARVERWTVTSASVRNPGLHLEQRLLGKTASTENVGQVESHEKLAPTVQIISSRRRTAWLQG